MRGRTFKYVFVVIAISVLLPLLVPAIPPFFELVFRKIPEMSSFNQDTGENNQYTITGTVENFAGVQNSKDIFIRLEQFVSYTIFNIRFSVPKFVALITIDGDGKFKISHLPAGRYQLVPITRPSQNIYFGDSYSLTLKDHNPDPVLIRQPLSSPFDYLVDLGRFRLTK